MNPMKKLIASLSVMASLALAAPQATAGAVYHHWSETPAEVQATHSPEVIQGWIDAYWANEWVNAYWFNRWMEAAAENAKRTGGAYVQGVEVCNGTSLPPCHVVRRESNFDPNARNPRSTAWGLYQFLRGTWNSVCPEFPHGSATVAQQVECARRLWDNGRGKSHWVQTL